MKIALAILALILAAPASADIPTSEELEAQRMIQTGQMQETIGRLALQLIAAQRQVKQWDAEVDAETDAND